MCCSRRPLMLFACKSVKQPSCTPMGSTHTPARSQTCTVCAAASRQTTGPSANGRDLVSLSLCADAGHSAALAPPSQMGPRNMVAGTTLRLQSSARPPQARRCGSGGCTSATRPRRASRRHGATISGLVRSSRPCGAACTASAPVPPSSLGAISTRPRQATASSSTSVRWRGARGWGTRCGGPACRTTARPHSTLHGKSPSAWTTCTCQPTCGPLRPGPAVAPARPTTVTGTAGTGRPAMCGGPATMSGSRSL
mmetsp:Transcript_56284/g.100251  ORF Transcript_56284/g.100251 Transcript_56284/m.100251 type:complete len:253 (-) Transcript_56284:207-965(-)